MTIRRPVSRKRPAATPHRNSSPYLDPYLVPGTITLAEYRAARAKAGEVHVVLPLEDTHSAA